MPAWLAGGTFFRGSALAEQGQEEEGIAQIRQGLDCRPSHGCTDSVCRGILARLAEAHSKVGQGEEGLNLLEEATVVMRKTEERQWEAELYRLKGELTLAQSSVQRLESSVPTKQKSKGKSQKSKIPEPKSQIPNPQSEAEACFLKAIEVARKQQAKSLELRAVMSLEPAVATAGQEDRSSQDCYLRFTTGSPKALIRKTCKRRKRCLKSYRKEGGMRTSEAIEES